MAHAHDEYFARLKGRLTVAVWYRNFFLYPRLSRYLRGRVLDIGCGIGDMVRFRRDTVGVDVNPHAVEHCRAQGLDVRLMEPDRLPFEDRSFDGAILDNVLEHLERPEPLLSEAFRVLKAGASFVVGVPGRRGYAWDSDHKRFYDEAALIRCVTSAGFVFERMMYQPCRSKWLDAHLRIYVIYGVYRRT